MKHEEPIQVVKLSPNKITFYHEFTNCRRNSRSVDLSYYSVDTSDSPALTENQKRTHQGTLSESAQKNLLNCTQRFVYFNKKEFQKN